MKFSEVYQQWCNPVPRFQVENNKPLFCSHTRTNIFAELDEIKTKTVRSKDVLRYYLWYMDSLGDATKPQFPAVCFDTYKKLYAHKWETDLRRKQINNANVNKELCYKFNIPERYKGVTFESIDKIKEQEVLINTAKNWCKHGFKETLLLGSQSRGIGKTTTAVCSAMEFYIRNDKSELTWFKGDYNILNSSIVFLKEHDLIKLVPNKFDFNPPYYRASLLNRLAEVDLLVYDDLMKYADNDFIKEFILPLFDDRVDNKGKATIITTTFNQTAFQRNQPDLWSRLQRGKVFYTNINTDFRKGTDIATG